MIPTKVLIFGRGQLGSFYREHFASKGAAVESPEGDIRDEAFVSGAVSSAQPDLIINVAAKTNIDWCEMNRAEAFAINTLGADVVAKVAEERGIYLVHVSSGCVQESLTADVVHTEEDAPHPLCFYSWTKVWAENLLSERAERGSLKVLMLRPRQLLSSMVSPRNALVKMMTYSKFIDTPNSCTIVEDLMDATAKLVAKEATGLYNVANPGVTTPLHIAELLKKHLKPEMVFSAITKEELNRMTLAKRIDCVLSMKKLEKEGIALRPIEERLVDILGDLKHNLESDGADATLRKTEAETREKLALVG
ncbi:MAG: sugar nucleotide-binding protein [Patescibacteria group bacterium]